MRGTDMVRIDYDAEKGLFLEYHIEDGWQGMKRLPDKSVGLVLTDPPYGIGIERKVGGNNLAVATEYKAERGWDKERETVVLCPSLIYGSLVSLPYPYKSKGRVA